MFYFLRKPFCHVMDGIYDFDPFFQRPASLMLFHTSLTPDATSAANPAWLSRSPAVRGAPGSDTSDSVRRSPFPPRPPFITTVSPECFLELVVLVFMFLRVALDAEENRVSDLNTKYGKRAKPVV